MRFKVIGTIAVIGAVVLSGCTATAAQLQDVPEDKPSPTPLVIEVEEENSTYKCVTVMDTDGNTLIQCIGDMVQIDDNGEELKLIFPAMNCRCLEE